MHVGQKIRLARKAKDLTQTDLGVALGVSQRNISDLESGKTRVRTDLVIKIAKILDAPVEELLAWEPGTLHEQEGQGRPSGESYVLPLRGTVPFSRFVWPERITKPAELVAIPNYLYEGQRIVLKAGDDSMEPEIRLNDLCVFDPTVSPVHGCIVCARVGSEKDGACVVRWYLDTGDAVVLEPESRLPGNPQTIVLVKQRGGVYRYLGDDVDFEVKGVLVGLVRSYAIPR